ncbi:hypothetical protein T12_12819 [Trichinella patagoniensis]|uniref:Uncharacterized protein n=1 Tax=Trichinella patagoniensis TaxID=990121 RepID=A0A0V0ZP36_9BILA|nr:hypothetical protein T12_12819 [Trichinella patagoniensis]
MGARKIGVPCISYLILIDDNAMDALEEFRILNRRREAILAMIDQLLRWVNDLSMALIEQYHRISLDHYIMITTEITLLQLCNILRLQLTHVNMDVEEICEDMAQLQQEEESTVVAVFAVFSIHHNRYIATRRRRRL